jgi:hypothetical protein
MVQKAPVVQHRDVKVGFFNFGKKDSGSQPMSFVRLNSII